MTSGTMIVQIVSNPHSGRYDQKLIDRLGLAYRQAGFEPRFTESSPTSPFALIDGADRLCIAGGDGTVRHVLAALAAAGAAQPVDVYPAGTINLVARERWLPGDPSAFVASALAAAQPDLFPVRLNETHFMACASIGPDARAVDEVSVKLKGVIGRFAYAVAMLKIAARWQRPKLLVKIGADALPCEALYVAKGRYFGGPWSFAPQARLDQPLLHIVLLRTARRRDYLAFMLAMATGKVDRLANAVKLNCTELSVECDVPHAIQVDGDSLGGIARADMALVSAVQ
jgi:diacylglycerol kinase (ATP)